MRNECNIVRDLLPLYHENMVSEDSKAFVENHLKNCTKCSLELDHMKKPSEFSANTDMMPLQNLKRKLLMKKIQTVIFTTALVLAIIVSLFAVLTAPRYFPYSSDQLDIIENENKTVTVIFNEEVTGYTYYDLVDADTGIRVYEIEAWDTAWDVNITNRGTQSITIPSADEDQISVYYLQNNGDENILIYGTDLIPSGGIISLPRLVLNYYFYAALLFAGLVTITMLIFRKNESLRIWLAKVLLLPISYMLGHICIKGFSGTTYSVQRDFFVIILCSILFYFISLTGINLFRMKRKKSQ